jgi:ParB/RepB/Spo0J family partition protein
MNELIQIETERLERNDYNPNRMSDAEFNELVNEVTRLGRLPKPVVVRPNGNPGSYLIVDGEHGWSAAIKAGLKTIPCEIIEADDFEAMRQTYKRNQHGTHAPVLLGKLFKRMMQERGLSQRAMAKEIDVSEGTIRNALEYEAAAQVRNDYAWDKLTVKQVRLYNRLPRAIGDLWLKTGAKVKDLFDGVEVADALAQSEQLHSVHFEYLEKTGVVEFLGRWHWNSFRRAVSYMEAWDRQESHWAAGGVNRETVRGYLDKLVDFNKGTLSPDKVNEAFFYIIDANAEPARFRLTLQDVADIAARASDHDNLIEFFKAQILEKGLRLPVWKFHAEKEAQARLRAAEILNCAPDYIKNCEWGLEQRYALWKFDGITEEMRAAISKEDGPLSTEYWNLYRWIHTSVKQIEADAERRAQWELLTDEQAAEQIALNIPLYEKEKDGVEIQRMARVLSQLTKAELIFLLRFTQDINREWEEIEHIKRLARKSEAMKTDPAD